MVPRRPAPRRIRAESPSTPLLRLTDLAGLAALAHEAGVLLSVDCTLATPRSRTVPAHAQRLAEGLQAHPKVTRVIYPGVFPAIGNTPVQKRKRAPCEPDCLSGRRASGDGLFWLSVGSEDPDDQIADRARALGRGRDQTSSGSSTRLGRQPAGVAR